MAADLGNLSIAQLEALINTRKSKLSSLYEKRDQLTKQLEALNSDIETAEGKTAAGATRGRPAHFTRTAAVAKRKGATVQRAQNDKSLKTYVEEVLAASKKGLTIGEIQEAVLKNGYTTNSANFKNTLYQCLYHNEKAFALDKKTKTYKLGVK
jgi:hypothetical protein